MKINLGSGIPRVINNLLIVVIAAVLTACGSDSGDSDKQGYIKFFNASKNAPAIHLTVDEDLDTSEDDDLELTFGAVEFGQALNRNTLSTDHYFYELAWQDGDSSERSELALIYQGELTIEQDTIHFIVLNEDVNTPNVQVYDIELIDDSDDDLYERFNLRLLNLHSPEMTTDVYISKSDQTFSEAVLVGSYGYQQLSENQKFDQGSYVFYLTEAGSDEVMFQSKTIDYFYASQYLMVIRENTGAGASPFILDKLSSASQTTYIDFNAEAQFNVYNAIAEHELLPEYSGSISMNFTALEQSLTIENLAYGQLSDWSRVNNGDYSVDVTSNEQEISLLHNHLLTLPENTNKTVIFYTDVKNVDDDDDGDVDEDGDGIVDQQEVIVHSLVLDNSTSESIYNHKINMVNLVDSEDFTLVNVYFIRADETIATALYQRSLGFTSDDTITLNNNTYQVYVTAKDNSSNIVLTSFALTLDESSRDQFMVIENDPYSVSGYKASLFDQLIE
ncbi:hypothetical protein tinsulaeT_19350 [Thalassotalea insulae]|uniref:Uncharacterized protein n=1 Tax=Thalassotalea insulae TaxID=2056778 RepID=A0ABQ6GVQ6_9GAMM|nr:hypothetical protein [Thalassotalea insulae]GLX78595.1 hypothetical protein tinsulaeT_19350 [Thalassotalea insulae]